MVRGLVIQPEVNGETTTYICSILPRQFPPRLTEHETCQNRISVRNPRAQRGVKKRAAGWKTAEGEGECSLIRSGRPLERRRISDSPRPSGKNHSLQVSGLRWASSNIVQHRAGNYGREKKPKWWASVQVREWVKVGKMPPGGFGVFFPRSLILTRT
jgi:hypothetical protein